MEKKKSYKRQYETAKRNLLNQVNELKIKGFHFNKRFLKSIEKENETPKKADVKRMKALQKKTELYKRATSYTYQDDSGKHHKTSVAQGRLMREREARQRAKDSYRETLENTIISIPDNYYFYHRAANGRMFVEEYNVEDEKWKCLDIIESRDKKDITKRMNDEVADQIEYVRDIAPSQLQQDDVSSMFSNIKAILNGGKWNDSAMGSVSTVGTPYFQKEFEEDIEGL